MNASECVKRLWQLSGIFFVVAGLVESTRANQIVLPATCEIQAAWRVNPGYRSRHCHQRTRDKDGIGALQARPVEQHAEGGGAVAQQPGVDRGRFHRGVARGNQVVHPQLAAHEVGMEQLDLALR